MQNIKREDSYFILEEKTIQREFKPPNNFNTKVEHSLESSKLVSISLNIVGIDKILKLVIHGFLKLIEMIFKLFLNTFKMLLEHPVGMLILITFFVGPHLPTEKIEALKELFMSLATLFL